MSEQKAKTEIYKKWWFWLAIGFLVMVLLSRGGQFQI
ncbi:hypothetical protein N752_20675 [Desulforamulus aquiferis]|nr:hypothetical protein N752_20675 [Desulforamulus aquiferis]